MFAAQIGQDASVADVEELASVRLGPEHVATGFTKHFYGLPDGPRVEVPAPISLRIVRYGGDSACYLLYCDEAGNELTDTWHESLDDAMTQARLEFSVSPDEWTATN